jgi:NADPH-dependent curcumin reductase CurA
VQCPKCLANPNVFCRYESGTRFRFEKRADGEGKHRASQVMTILSKKRIRVQGFTFYEDYGPHFGEFLKQMTERLEVNGFRVRSL